MHHSASVLLSITLCLSVLGVSRSRAQLPESQVKVALHIKSHAAKASTICQSEAPVDLPCSQYVTSGSLGTGYDLYVTAGQADTNGVAGLSFGIDYDGIPGSGVDVVGPWFLCASGLEFPSNNWPDAGSGNILTWNTADCGRLNLPPDGYHGIAGAFYVYAYSEDTFSITEHMLVQGDPILRVANCLGQEKALSLSNVGSVGFSGGGTLAGFNPCEGSSTPQTSEISPSTLNAASHGKWITAHVELPAGLDPEYVRLSSVRLQGTIPADLNFDIVEDFNDNGIPDRTFKFDRTEFIMSIPLGVETVEAVVTGYVVLFTPFTFAQPIRIVRPEFLSPNGGESLIAGSIQEIVWDVPSGWNGTTADLYFSSDGLTWTAVASGIAGTRHLWQVPADETETARLRVEIHDEFGILGWNQSSDTFAITSQVGVGASQLPDVYALLQNSPNPFTAVTTIHYELPVDAPVALDVYDVSGRNVRRLVNRNVSAGHHEEVWDGRDDSGQRVASGIYFYRMKTPGYEHTQRLFILR